MSFPTNEIFCPFSMVKIPCQLEIEIPFSKITERQGPLYSTIWKRVYSCNLTRPAAFSFDYWFIFILWDYSAIGWKIYFIKYLFPNIDYCSNIIFTPFKRCCVRIIKIFPLIGMLVSYEYQKNIFRIDLLIDIKKKEKKEDWGIY